MHSMIIGMTESGKSTLGKILALQLLSNGKQVIVLDPIFDPEWKATYKTDDIDELVAYLKRVRSCYVFIDESGSYFNEGNDNSYSWLSTRSRHYGHSVTFLAQRAIQIPKTMRDQCSRLFLFTSSQSDGKIHSEEWNKPELEQCNKLKQLEFFHCDRYTVFQRMYVHNYKEVRSHDSGRNDSNTGDTYGNGSSSATNRKVGRGKGKDRQ